MEPAHIELLKWLSERPGAVIVILLVVLFLLLVAQLGRSIKRYRDEVVRRLAECEDAHLERDKIQLDLVSLVAEQMGATGREGAPERRASVRDFCERAEQIIEDIHSLNSEMLKRRGLERRIQEDKLIFKLPWKLEKNP